MKILIDSNILVSALFYPSSNPSKVLYHVADNHELILCDKNINELRSIAKRKFANMQADIDLFLTELPYELITAIESPEKIIRDPKDNPILNAAIISNVDIIITGDNDFLVLDLEYPKTMKVIEYIEQYMFE
jgi:putative PIN family toxin of toxin-antitoxin system